MERYGVKDWIDLLSGNYSETEIELPVLSPSMDPYLPVSSIVTVKLLSLKEIKKLHRGAIIVYRTKFRLTAHRMIIKVPFMNYIYEKGDRNSSGSFVRYDEIIGVVLSVKNNDTLIRDFFSKDEIKNAGRVALKNLFSVLKNRALTPPRRIKNVLFKK